MFIFLPPSETKRSPARGRSCELQALMLPGLEPARRRILAAVGEASVRDDAAAVFGVSEALLPTVRANAGACDAPSAAAHQVYEGVLYDALDYGSLSAGAKRRASKAVVFSALLGPVRLTDRIPAYRASAGTKIRGASGAEGAKTAPALSRTWRLALEEEAIRAPLPWDGELVIDCRSSGYASMWPAKGAKTLPVDVFQQTDKGLKVISHFAKHARGLAARILLEQPIGAVRSPEQAAQVLDRIGGELHGWRVSLEEAGAAASLRIVLPAAE